MKCSCAKPTPDLNVLPMSGGFHFTCVCGELNEYPILDNRICECVEPIPDPNANARFIPCGPLGRCTCGRLYTPKWARFDK